MLTTKSFNTNRIESISDQNLEQLTILSLELWSEIDFVEEKKSWRMVLNSENEICYLVKIENTYIGFIHIAIRQCYVEGAENFPVAYVEAVYIKDGFRNSGIASELIKMGELWTKSKGLSQMASDAEIDNKISIEFHKKVGFEEVNRVVCFIKDI